MPNRKSHLKIPTSANQQNLTKSHKTKDDYIHSRKLEKILEIDHLNAPNLRSAHLGDKFHDVRLCSVIIGRLCLLVECRRRWLNQDGDCLSREFISEGASVELGTLFNVSC